MGIERFEDSAEEPTGRTDASAPGCMDSSRDASRSEEAPQSGVVRRPEEPAPDSSPRSLPDQAGSEEESADAEEMPAEPRTRTEYADYIASPDTPPIEGDSPSRETEDPCALADGHGAEVPSGHGDGEESHSARDPDEQRTEQPWNEDQPDTGSQSTSLSSQREEAHDDAETDGGLNADSGAQDVLGRELDAREPPTADEPDSQPSDAPSTREADRGAGAEPDLIPSPEPGVEDPTEDRHAAEDPEEDTLEIDEHTSPLADQEWSEHLVEVRQTLDRARGERLETHLVYTIDPDHQSWSKERRELHNSIINDLYSAAENIPNMGHALVAGGLGGAGKTTVLTERAGVDKSQYLFINPDDLKEEMARRGMIPEIEGLSPMEASDLVHEESSYLARQLALRAYGDRKNVIWDITMSNEGSTAARLDEMRSAGYERIDGLFVDIPVETSVRRTESRHREGYEKFLAGDGLGGRYVPPKVIRDQADPEWGSQNKRTFNNLKSRFNNWSVYDNSMDERPALIIDSSKRNEAGQ